MTMRISKDRVDMDNKELQKPVLKNYGEAVITDNSGSTYTIDLTQGNVFNIMLTNNCAFTFANPPISGTAGSFTLILTQDSTGSRTATWPTAVRWPSGTAPTLYTTSGSVNIYTFLTVNNGTLWLGADARGVEAPPPNPYIPYGYFGGGYDASDFPSSALSTVDRIDYSNDTATATVKGPLSTERYLLAATGNSSYGYFAGGSDTSFNDYSTVDRIDYANDTATAVLKGPLSSIRTAAAATGTSSYGYFGGGESPVVSTVDRIDYSSDSTAMISKGPLSSIRTSLAATGNSSYGYFGGGGPNSYSGVSTVDRIDYSSDSTAMISKGPLSAARYYLAATGTSSYGYFGGGQASPNFSTVDRIDYTNDTATASVRGPLSVALSTLAASGNSSYGYFGGGGHTAINRIDYSNDTLAAITKGSLPTADNNWLAATNHNPI